jgi:hypothetical protein
VRRQAASGRRIPAGYAGGPKRNCIADRPRTRAPRLTPESATGGALTNPRRLRLCHGGCESQVRIHSGTAQAAADGNT